MSSAVLVIGGGIAGIQASIDLAEIGFKVYLVEKSPSIGGRMAQLDKTFPTNDCSICILAPKMADCNDHPNINVLTYSEVKGVKGEAGNFEVKVLKKARLVDEKKCTGCGECTQGCPIETPNEFDMGLGMRKAAYLYFPQAVPMIATIDKREERPCQAACKDACPIHMNVLGYIALTKEGKFKEAYELIRRTNPLPAVCGRVCYAPCEDACNRGQIDEAIASRALKRFVADQIDIESLEIPEISRNGKKVAIIGSGPAGLSAAHDLALKGYGVTMFEALPQPGGMLQYGIPEYRLPKDVLRKEIEYIERLGVEIKTNHKVEALEPFFGQGYQTVLVAVGSPQSVRRGALVSAISGRPDPLKGFGLESTKLNGERALKVDFATFATSRGGVFAAGDVTTGPTSVIDAIASGKKAARSIDEYLKGEPLTSKEDKRVPQRLSEEEVAALKELFPSQNRVKAKELEPRQRISGFEEVEQVYSAPEAQQEARRCLASQIEGCIGCGECEERCQAGAIDFGQKDEELELTVGAIIVAIGFEPYDPSPVTEYGYKRFENVITALEFERLICASGPTEGHLKRLSDGREPKRIAFIQCVGSRDLKHNKYCAAVCCMHATKEAILAREHDPEVESFIFYTDLRASGKGFQDYVARAEREYGVTYIRGRVGKIDQNSDENLVIHYINTLSLNPSPFKGEGKGEGIENMQVDLAVLATCLVPRKDASELADILGIQVSENKFFQSNPFSPVETGVPGIFLCGYCEGPKDIPESVTQAGAAAMKAAEFLRKPSPFKGEG